MPVLVKAATKRGSGILALLMMLPVALLLARLPMGHPSRGPGHDSSMAGKQGNPHIQRVITMRATAYIAGKVQGRTGITRSGLPTCRGIVAVDHHFIPLGTHLYVEGYGPALAADTGKNIKGDRIDLCVTSRREAIQLGVRKVKVIFL